MFILGHMLLHKLFINVAIANIFLQAPALYDLRRLNYNSRKNVKNSDIFPKTKKDLVVLSRQ